MLSFNAHIKYQRLRFVVRWILFVVLPVTAIWVFLGFILFFRVAEANSYKVQAACPLNCSAFKSMLASMNDETETNVVGHWHFRRQLGRMTVEISVGWTTCTRQQASVIRVQTVERPSRAVITARVRIPTPPPATPCLRQRRIQNIRVRLRTPVSRLKLYDGSYSPPKLRWPK